MPSSRNVGEIVKLVGLAALVLAAFTAIATADPEGSVQIGPAGNGASSFVARYSGGTLTVEEDGTWDFVMTANASDLDVERANIEETLNPISPVGFLLKCKANRTCVAVRGVFTYDGQRVNRNEDQVYVLCATRSECEVFLKALKGANAASGGRADEPAVDPSEIPCKIDYDPKNPSRPPEFCNDAPQPQIEFPGAGSLDPIERTNSHKPKPTHQIGPDGNPIPKTGIQVPPDTL